MTPKIQSLKCRNLSNSAQHEYMAYLYIPIVDPDDGKAGPRFGCKRRHLLCNNLRDKSAFGHFLTPTPPARNASVAQSLDKNLPLSHSTCGGTHRVFRPKFEITLREVRHDVDHLLHGEVTHSLLKDSAYSRKATSTASSATIQRSRDSASTTRVRASALGKCSS